MAELTYREALRRALDEELDLQAGEMRRLGFTADANTRYDLYGDFLNRAITPAGATASMRNSMISHCRSRE